MSKLFVFILLCVFSLSVLPTQVDAIGIAASPSSVNKGEPVSVSISSIPKNSGFTYSLKLYRGSLELNTILTLQTNSNGSCNISPNEMWTNNTLRCSLSGHAFNFDGKIDTSKVPHDSTATDPQSYNLQVMEQGTNLVASSAFSIKPIQQSVAQFNIDSITPDPVKPQETVTIRLSNTAAGTYIVEAFGYGESRKNQTCPASSCTVSLRIPGSVNKSPVAIWVTYEPMGTDGTKTQEISVTLNACSTKKALECDERGLKCINNECVSLTAAANNAYYGCTKEQIEQGECTAASGKLCPIVGNDKPGILTAIGCVPTDPTSLTKTILRLATGVAGGIAFLLMIFGAFQMITSSGNPETLKAGQDKFSSAIIGLLFIIFSVLILKIIGVDILGLSKAFGI